LREYCDFPNDYRNSRSSSKLSSIDNLQLAFLQTFPKNIALAADTDLEYPFYLMVRDKTLMKVHGSSIVPLYTDKPKWVSCQNLVISSITGRPMARLVVPIAEEHLKSLEIVEYERIKEFQEQQLACKFTEKNIGTSILRFLRSKNHNQVIQVALEKNQAYLETDDLKEVIVYFYVNDVENLKGKKLAMMQMIEKLGNYYKEAVGKRHFLPSISERTKLHVNEYGRVIDILSGREFISFGIKASGQDYLQKIKDLASSLQIPESLFDAYEHAQRGLINVQVNNKKLAAKLFQAVNGFCVSRNTRCSRCSSTRFPFLWC
jgi:hypothetical protein